MLASRFGDAASYLAGGSDLMVQINRHRRALAHLIALGSVAELSGIEVGAERTVIGALTTMKEIERHPTFAAPPLVALREAAQVVGGHQVRNVATIGGNVVNASPAADLVPVLLALDSELALSGPTGDRRLPLADFLCGPGLTTRHPGELLRQVTFTPPRGAASAFLKAGRRRAMEISLVCVAVLLQLDERARCRNVRIALGAVGPTAVRARDAETLLEGLSRARPHSAWLPMPLRRRARRSTMFAPRLGTAAGWSL
jgi:carbon-monoxide dehydrogenase medium subunit